MWCWPFLVASGARMTECMGLRNSQFVKVLFVVVPLNYMVLIVCVGCSISKLQKFLMIEEEWLKELHTVRLKKSMGIVRIIPHC